MKFIALLYRLYVQCWSQGRAKLRAFPRHLEREITQLSPSLTPTLGTCISKHFYYIGPKLEPQEY